MHKRLAALWLCGPLLACGAGGPAAPAPGGPGPVSPASPTPRPSPSVTKDWRLHVLQTPWVVTYEIDPSGLLRPPMTQHLGRDVVQLAGEPQGRFVYALRGNGAIVSYVPDPADGTLVKVSETLAWEGDVAPSTRSWSWLKAGANRVYGLWMLRWGTALRHTTYSFVSAPSGSDGQLGPVSAQSFDFDADPGRMLVDVGSDVLYKAGVLPVTPGTVGHARGGLEAHVIGAGGTLERMGWSNLCFAREICETCVPSPVVAARGYLFSAAYLPPDQPLCFYQGLRLKPLDAVEFPGASVGEAFVPESSSEPALVAIGSTKFGPGGYAYGLRLYELRVDGDLRLLDSREQSYMVSRLLFHPSGRALYVADPRDLGVYAVGADGRLSPTMSLDGASGSLALSSR